jgi:HD-GYP domain-containing protein (c-di-GMP phosphodiesterase class II)
MIEERPEFIHQRELFARLRKSVSLKREEECFSGIIKPAFWWLVEKERPGLADVRKQVSGCCPCPRKEGRSRDHRCAGNVLNMLRMAFETKRLVRYDCYEGMHGFAYPVVYNDKLLGYIGACYAKKDVPSEMLDLFAAFTDTIVREVQKEYEMSKLYETLRPRAIALSTVHTVHRLISSTLDLNELLPRIARLSLQIMRANRCSIKLVDYRRKTLLPKATVDLRKKKIRLKKVRVGTYAPGKAVKYGRPIRGKNYLATPLIDADVIGVITIYDKVDGKSFSQFDQEIMSTLAEQAVIAIKNAQLYKEQERLTMGTIKSLAMVLNTRAPGTYIPRASFVKIALAIAQEMHLDSDSMKSLEYASILHDAGEIFVPQDVLAKPSKLTGREFAIVKAHPAASVEIIRHMKALRSATPIILYHHENYDGSGYPKGLRKDQIPLGARIMAVVSAFEAMITKKPYRIAKTIEQATEEIRSNSGSQFDPKIVDIFLRVLKKKDVRSALEKELAAAR